MVRFRSALRRDGGQGPARCRLRQGRRLPRSLHRLSGRPAAAAGKRIRLFVVDLWDGWFYDDYRQQTPMPESADVYWQFLHNMQACGVCHCLCPIKLPSERAAALFADASVDFVYLDGDHGGAAVRRNLEAWFPKIRSGGVLAGHDYLNKDFPGVRNRPTPSSPRNSCRCVRSPGRPAAPLWRPGRNRGRWSVWPAAPAGCSPLSPLRRAGGVGPRLRRHTYPGAATASAVPAPTRPRVDRLRRKDPPCSTTSIC